MTTTITTAPSSTSGRVTMLAGLVAGTALVVDTVTITVINSSFGVLDDTLFFVGLLGLPVTLVALAIQVSARHRGARRAGIAVLVFVGAVVVLGLLSQAMDTMGHHVFSAANVGLHGEWSFFTLGVCLLAVSAWSARPR